MILIFFFEISDDIDEDLVFFEGSPGGNLDLGPSDNFGAGGGPNQDDERQTEETCRDQTKFLHRASRRAGPEPAKFWTEKAEKPENGV